MGKAGEIVIILNLKMDKQIQNLIKKECQRQEKMVHLIPSENFVSKEILAALRRLS